MVRETKKRKKRGDIINSILREKKRLKELQRQADNADVGSMAYITALLAIRSKEEGINNLRKQWWYRAEITIFTCPSCGKRSRLSSMLLVRVVDRRDDGPICAICPHCSASHIMFGPKAGPKWQKLKAEAEAIGFNLCSLFRLI